MLFAHHAWRLLPGLRSDSQFHLPGSRRVAPRWNEHRLGWLLAAIVAFQIPYRTWALRQGGRSAFSPHQATAFAVVLLILLVANWGLQMLGAS